jgi:ATP phosphoribosyltransferase
MRAGHEQSLAMNHPDHTALSKGRIFEDTVPLLKAAGIVPAGDHAKSRKLIIGTNRDDACA